ncbi:flagellar basal body L-ring protein FlgH [Wenzhouxiangella sp. AB-CW3]|uniref:flagellar basal body L-ring protein FlgH n=1 Tax=Wenzhouxiangella sp. AB-CW3 TaxID=2771012 RepID=UPI00398C61B7
MKWLASLAAIGLLVACATPQPIDDWTATMPEPPVMAEEPVPTGSIYQTGRGGGLFEDVKAQRVGDTITVRLVESTTASASASTNTQRGTSSEISNPTLFGNEPTRRSGLPLFSNVLGSDHEFNGEGSSEQSHQMDGNITVTVYKRLPNGNLMVRGERWITINQSREYLRIAGIVRPADIRPDNSVPSFKVADARIDYRATGTLADSNRQGWLSRFFQSPLTPF